jgi:ubiquinone/menaquinone biosynthesis C-methylase UbiE
MDIKKLLKDKSFVNLDIEGKLNPQKGFLTMDSRGEDNVDVAWHFNKLPWIFPDNTFSLVRADQVITKVPRKKIFQFMNEVWRVLKPEGQFMVSAAYPNSYLFYQDPLNVNPMNEATFAHFDPLEGIAGKYLYKIYKPKPWKICHMSFQVNGLMEVLLEKRREDTSYGQA